MINRCLALFGSALLLAGCAAQTTPPRQYLLDRPTLGNATLTIDDESASLLIDEVDVAAFLDASGIVYQTADNEVTAASQHRWAEPVERQLRRTLYTVLAKRLNNVAVFERRPDTPANAARLSVSLDAFQGHYSGDAIIAGTWRLTSDNGDILARQRFRVERPLPEDGYTALVRTLSGGWQEIATNITDRIKPLLTSP